MESQWRTTIWPYIRECDFSCVVELAAGHGRNGARLLEVARTLHLVDINLENVEILRRRFGERRNLVFLHVHGRADAVRQALITGRQCR